MAGLVVRRWEVNKCLNLVAFDSAPLISGKKMAVAIQ